MLQGIIRVLQFHKMFLSEVGTTSENRTVEEKIHVILEGDFLWSLLSLLQKHYFV